MDPNDPATVAAVLASLTGALVGAYATCFGVVALVDFFKKVAR